MKYVVNGRHDEGYKVLPQYIQVFKEKNPDSLCFINWKDEGPGKNPSFKRCQICIGAAISAFKEHYRPFIGIDACHLKGPYKGILIRWQQWAVPYTLMELHPKKMRRN